MNVSGILENYESFVENSLKDRFFKHKDIIKLINALPSTFSVSEQGKSVEGRAVNLIKWGNGPVKIFIWSQMHGDEPTGTMAIFDLINLLQHQNYADTSTLLSNACTLYLMPMVNPDGAEIFTRRNIQQVDINRDYIAENTPEGRILKSTRADIRPSFGFNLHDQVTLWSVKGSNKPATLSYLAPAYNSVHDTDEVRGAAKLVIAEMFRAVYPLLSGHIGLFDETYEPRAFGDNFQKEGTSTILVEAGGFADDYEKQHIRKYFFLSLLSGIYTIAKGTYHQQLPDNYTSIPPNAKTLYHTIIHNVKVNGMQCSISLNYEEETNKNYDQVDKIWYVHDIGDVTGWEAYTIYNDEYEILAPVKIDQKANFELLQNGKLILSFKNGILVHS